MVRNTRKHFATRPMPGPLGKMAAWVFVLSMVHHESHPLSRYITPEYQIAIWILVNVAEFIILLFLLRAVLEFAVTPIRRLVQRDECDHDEANSSREPGPHEPSRGGGPVQQGDGSLDIRDQVKDMARRAPRDPEQTSLPAGIGESEIHSFELRTGVVVPLALREWLGFTNGPRIGRGGIFGIQTADEWFEIESFYKDGRFPEWLQNGWIPIAGDGCGGIFVIATREPDSLGAPVFFISSDPRIVEPEYIAASDLWHFLRFYLGEEFGERDWPFDRVFVLARDPELAHFSAVPRAWELEE